MVGACGKTKRIAGQPVKSSSRTIGTKSEPSAPRPCIQITETVGLGAVSIWMVSSRGLFIFYGDGIFNFLLHKRESGHSCRFLPDCRLRPECLAHCLVGFDIRPADQID